MLLFSIKSASSGGNIFPIVSPFLVLFLVFADTCGAFPRVNVQGGDEGHWVYFSDSWGL